MELNLVPLIEAAKGITTQGAIVIVACLAAACYLSRLRHIHAEKERQWWASVPPEISQARAATTATLPPPTKPPMSPVGPALILMFLAGCLALRTDTAAAQRSILRPARRGLAIGDFVHDERAVGLPMQSIRGPYVQK